MASFSPGKYEYNSWIDFVNEKLGAFSFHVDVIIVYDNSTINKSVISSLQRAHSVILVSSSAVLIVKDRLHPHICTWWLA